MDNVYTEVTQKLLKEAIINIDNRKERIHQILEDVKMLCSYVQTPEEVTSILKNYNIINQDNKLNFDL